MKISKMADTNLVPDWAYNEDNKSSYLKNSVSSSDVQRLLFKDFSKQDDLSSEREVIEKCASSGNTYFYSAQWPLEVISNLKEYAGICKLAGSSFKSVNPDVLINEIKVLSNTNARMVKTASKKSLGFEIDAFKIDEKLNAVAKKGEWEKISKEQILSDKPSLNTNAIASLRSEDNYYANAEVKTARGQNSITNPEAIGNFINDKTEDNGARLKRENIEKIDAQKKNHKDWQDQKIAGMNDKSIVGNRKVFNTQCLNAYSGIKEDIFKMEGRPDKTVGESIKDVNDQKQKDKKHDFEVKKSCAINGVSGIFGSELAKYLK